MTLHSRRHIMNSLFVGLFVLYLLAGIVVVPFHGDESATIHKAHDWFALIKVNIQPLLNSPNPVDPAERELRLLNGVISAYSTGFMMTAVGVPEQDIPQQWLWGADWEYNAANGHIPSEKTIFIGRLSSAFLTVISISLLFAFVRRISDIPTAWVATFIYGTTPAVLLNGRRAMYEGATLLAITLVLTAGLAVAYWIKRSSLYTNSSKLLRSWVLFGIASGFAMASKHILIVTILPVALALLILSRPAIIKALGYAILAGLIAFIVFLILNPAWWGSPIQTARDVIQLRRDISQGQVTFYGGYTNIKDNLIALVNMPIDPPQYYESTSGWPEWIGSQIKQYEQSGLSGIVWNLGGIAGLIALPVVLLLLVRTTWPDKGYALIFLSTFIFVLIAIFILTPFPWQRYYLPLAGLWSVAYAIALKTGVQLLWRKNVR